MREKKIRTVNVDGVEEINECHIFISRMTINIIIIIIAVRVVKQGGFLVVSDSNLGSAFPHYYCLAGGPRLTGHQLTIIK